MVKRQKCVPRESTSKQLKCHSDTESTSPGSVGIIVKSKPGYLNKKLAKTLKELSNAKNVRISTLKALNRIKLKKTSTNLLSDYFKNYESYMKEKHDALRKDFRAGHCKEAILSILACRQGTDDYINTWETHVSNTAKGVALEWFRIPKRHMNQLKGTKQTLYRILKNSSNDVKQMLFDWAVLFKTVVVHERVLSGVRERLFPGKPYTYFTSKEWNDDLKYTYWRMESSIINTGHIMSTLLSDYRGFSLRLINIAKVESIQAGKTRMFRTVKAPDTNVRVNRYLKIYESYVRNEALFVNSMCRSYGIDMPGYITLQLPNVKLKRNFLAEKKAAEEAADIMFKSKYEKRQEDALEDFTNCLLIHGLLTDGAIDRLSAFDPLFALWAKDDPKLIKPDDYFEVRSYIRRFYISLQSRNYSIELSRKAMRKFNETIAQLPEDVVERVFRPKPFADSIIIR